jgi:outer membrane protein assembly factor BamD (BamD/ComL family)
MSKHINERTSGLLAISLIVAAMAVMSPVDTAALYQAPVSQAGEELYRRAIQAFQENRFTDARTLFESVRGDHATEASRYLDNIKAYREAMEVAKAVLERSQDEIDTENLDFAISKLQQAISIKPDGPWDPRGQLSKASSLRDKLATETRMGSQARDKRLCEKAVTAARSQHYKDAASVSCLLANDNPGYLCGGDEAVNYCHQMQELSKISLPQSKPGSGGSEVATPKPTSGFDKAVAAYNKNQFDDAIKLLGQVGGGEQSEALEYVEKIHRYTQLMKEALEARQAAKYDDARVPYQQALQIKEDGPGDPRQAIVLLDLEQGIAEFYKGEYMEATQFLSRYVGESRERLDLANFYLGASKLGRFFLGGNRDSRLRQEALDHLSSAKKAGFVAEGQEVSPKILKAYREITAN